MNLEYLLLPVGIVLLVVPTAVYCGAKMRGRLDRPARRRDEGVSSLARTWVNWIDFLRGAAGTWLVQKPLQDSISSQDELATTFLVVQVAVLFVGVLAQTLWLHRPIRVIGPLFFVTGLTLALSGPLTGGFALVVGFCCALMVGRLSAVFSLVPVALVGFGFLFGEFGVLTAFNACAYALPAFLAFTFGTRISFVRRTADGHDRDVLVAGGGRLPGEALGGNGAAPPNEGVAVRDADAVIRPDFSHPPVATPVPEPIPQAAHDPAPVAARKVSGDAAQLPDFLRIAEEPETPRRKARRRLFPLRGA